MPEHFAYKSYAWSFGTTSFRMADFHRKVEQQLILLDEFWNIEEHRLCRWKSNPEIQKLYYDFLYEKGFITGKIQDRPDKKSKTARQKTSGLVDIGLIDDERRLTSVGKKLSEISLSGDFSCDNVFKIQRDSFLYLKQMIKTMNATEDWRVRPYLVTGKVIKACDGYLTNDEFAYLLPLCVSAEITEEIIKNIKLLRENKTTIDDVIEKIVLNRSNYQRALSYFVHADKTPSNIMIIGMNRDGARHDECYVELYEQLRKVYFEKNNSQVERLFEATRKIKNKPGTMWRELLFSSPRAKAMRCNLKDNSFSEIHSEEDFDKCFFKYLHLIKIKTTLSDYKDLNRRYLQITDSIAFKDGKIEFTPLFDSFFNTEAAKVFDDAFEVCDLLFNDCAIEDINKHLVFNDKSVIDVFNSNNHLSIASIDEVYDFVENDRYKRFRILIDTKFPNHVIVSMLDKFESRERDAELINMVGSDADVPTIFEYIVAIAWYRISGYKGKILDYMNLSLDADLLPRTHAGGGESDIVYKYAGTDSYPPHSLLIECTLMEGSTQRRGEMEPVSRHLANYMIDVDRNTYCTFVSNNLHPLVVSDFRMRKHSPTYRSYEEYVDDMKIIPLHTREFRTVIENRISYEQLYTIFDAAFLSDDIQSPLEWYDVYVKDKIEHFNIDLPESIVCEYTATDETEVLDKNSLKVAQKSE